MDSSWQLFRIGLCFLIFTIVEDVVDELLDVGTAVAAPVDLPEDSGQDFGLLPSLFLHGMYFLLGQGLSG